MHSASNPIGVLDSGLGGRSVLQALKSDLPHARLLYAADCAHAPCIGEGEDCKCVAKIRLI